MDEKAALYNSQFKKQQFRRELHRWVDDRSMYGILCDTDFSKIFLIDFSLSCINSVAPYEVLNNRDCRILQAAEQSLNGKVIDDSLLSDILSHLQHQGPTCKQRAIQYLGMMLLPESDIKACTFEIVSYCQAALIPTLDWRNPQYTGILFDLIEKKLTRLEKLVILGLTTEGE